MMKSLDDLFLHFLQDVYYAERQLLKALPKMAKNAQEPALAEAFTTHREETVQQIERLEQVFDDALLELATHVDLGALEVIDCDTLAKVQLGSGLIALNSVLESRARGAP